MWLRVLELESSGKIAGCELSLDLLLPPPSISQTDRPTQTMRADIGTRGQAALLQSSGDLD